MTPQELKNSILQLAIQGKLVEQRPEEGTAVELLEKILAAKNAEDAKKNLTYIPRAKRVCEAGVRRRDAEVTKESRLASNVSRPVEDAPFDIPESWEWVRLGEVCTIARGGSPRPIKDYITTAADGINWIKIGDTEKDGKYICSTVEKIKPSGVSKSRMVYAGDFLLTNSMSFGRPYILKINGCIHDGWLAISQGEKIFDQEYLYWVLSSGYAYAQFCAKVSGAVVKNLNSDKVANSVFPLPPLAEQKRIVAKIEELLPLVDRYEKAWSRLEDFNKRFPVDMQKSLLQMAIQGKLVEQRPEEGTGEELYRQIQVEKQYLVKSGKIKKEKPLPEITEDEIPFEIPDSWKWVRLGKIVYGLFAGGDKPSDFVLKSDSIHVVPVVGNGITNDGILGYTEKATAKARTITVAGRGTIGFSLYREYEYCPVVRLIVIEQSSGVFPKYLQFVLQGLPEKSLGTSIPQLTVPMLSPKMIPLPPLAEQKRIVAKLEELLPLCERLKAKSGELLST